MQEKLPAFGCLFENEPSCFDGCLEGEREVSEVWAWLRFHGKAPRELVERMF